MRNNSEKKFKRIPITTLVAVLTGSALLFSGCGKTTTTKALTASSVKETPVGTEAVVAASASVSSVSSEEKTEKIIGTKVEGANVVHMELTNDTGKVITGFAVKYTNQESYGDNMLPEKESFEKGETRTLYYDESDALKTVNSQSSSDNAPVVNPDYSIRLTFEDQSELELHSVPLNDIKTASILLNTEGSFLFLKYVSSSTGETISTEDAEKAALEASKATPTPSPTQVPTEQTAVETPAAEQPAAEQPAENTYQAPAETYTEPSTDYTAPSTTDGTDSGAGQTDTAPAPVNTDQGADAGEGCIDDGLTW